MTQAQVPSKLADYFTSEAVRDEHPVIVQQFRPVGGGWTNYPIRKRVSVSWLRKMRREGATGVAVRCGGRVADFTIDEVVRHAERESARPMFGGRII